MYLERPSFIVVRLLRDLVPAHAIDVPCRDDLHLLRGERLDLELYPRAFALHPNDRADQLQLQVEDLRHPISDLVLRRSARQRVEPRRDPRQLILKPLYPLPQPRDLLLIDRQVLELFLRDRFASPPASF